MTVPGSAPNHRSASFVFEIFINNTGWRPDGIAFMVGLINTTWAFACLDCATHLAEEVPRPERVIPIAIMGTIGIGSQRLSSMFSAYFSASLAQSADYATVLLVCHYSSCSSTHSTTRLEPSCWSRSSTSLGYDVCMRHIPGNPGFAGHSHVIVAYHVPRFSVRSIEGLMSHSTLTWPHAHSLPLWVASS